MNGIEAKIEGDLLVVKIPINKPLRPSASGKTLLVASTYGNKQTEAQIDGKKIVIGLNAYVYKGN